MKFTPIKAIIWDLDGTIIHFKIDYIRCRRITIKILKKHGIPKSNLTIKKNIFENIPNMVFIKDAQASCMTTTVFVRSTLGCLHVK